MKGFAPWPAMVSRKLQILRDNSSMFICQRQTQNVGVVFFFNSPNVLTWLNSAVPLPISKCYACFAAFVLALFCFGVCACVLLFIIDCTFACVRACYALKICSLVLFVHLSFDLAIWIMNERRKRRSRTVCEEVGIYCVILAQNFTS